MSELRRSWLLGTSPGPWPSSPPGGSVWAAHGFRGHRVLLLLLSVMSKLNTGPRNPVHQGRKAGVFLIPLRRRLGTRPPDSWGLGGRGRLTAVPPQRQHRLGSTLGASPGGGCRDRDSGPGNGASLSVAPEATRLTLTTRGAGACSVRPPPRMSPLVTVSKQAEQECALQSSEGKGNPCSPLLPAGRLSEHPVEACTSWRPVAQVGDDPIPRRGHTQAGLPSYSGPGAPARSRPFLGQEGERPWGPPAAAPSRAAGCELQGRFACFPEALRPQQGSPSCRPSCGSGGLC